MDARIGFPAQVEAIYVIDPRAVMLFLRKFQGYCKSPVKR